MTDLKSPGELVTVSQIAKMIGVSESAVSNYQNRNLGFPEPWGIWSNRTKLFVKTEVEEWVANRVAIHQLSVEKEIEQLEARLKELKGVKDA